MDFAEATNWVSGNAPAAQTDAPPANMETPPRQPQEQVTQGAPEGGAPPEGGTPNEDLTPYRELVDNLGGLDGVRQFDPLYKALANPSQDFSEIGRGVNGALKQLLGNDQYGAMAMALHDEFGELLAEQFVADHPEWIQAQIAKINGGQAPAEGKTTVGDDEDDFGEPAPALGRQTTPREKELTERLTAMESQLNEMTQAGRQTSEQQFRANVERQVFGTVVDQTFEKLQGWEEAEMQQVMRIAMSEFSNDPKAKESFQLAGNYLRSNQPLLANQLVRAQNAFQGHLKNAMELVDLKRQSARRAAAPVEPARQEFGSTAPTQPNTQQPTNREQNETFWNSDQLMAAVQRRLQERGAGRT